MGKDFYLLSVSVQGIKNIEKEVTLNFYKRSVDKSFDPDMYRIKAIYGENGVGKSALMTAISLFKSLILDENYLLTTEKQKLLKELINKKSRCFKFQCEFLNDNEVDISVYRYTTILRMNEMEKYELSYERLEKRNGNYSQSKYRDTFIVNEGVIETLNCDTELGTLLTEKSYNLLKTQTLISVYMRNIREVRLDASQPDLRWELLLCVILAFTIKVYLVDEDRHELYFAQKQLSEALSKEAVTEDYLDYFKKCLVEYTSVNETMIAKSAFEKYKQRVHTLTSFIKLFKRNLRNIEVDAKDNGDYLSCELVLDYGDYKIAKEFESTGIKKLIGLYDCLDAASRGGIVFIDEMDSNLNDIYLCSLLEYFMYYGKGQLCFTTHNIDPMNVLKENKKSIDFLSSDCILVPWVSKGNASPESYYKNGYIKNLPFNVDATDFLGILGVE